MMERRRKTKTGWRGDGAQEKHVRRARGEVQLKRVHLSQGVKAKEDGQRTAEIHGKRRMEREESARKRQNAGEFEKPRWDLGWISA